MPSARSVINRSCRTGSARTAGTTRDDRPSRSSGRVSPERASAEPKALDRVLGIRFKDPSLRETALTHRSHAFENGLTTNNERLEFLGDAVLAIVVTDMA